MTREQVQTIFPEATKEMIDAFLNAHNAEKTPLKTDAERLKALEQENETLKSANLTNEEKLAKQLEAAAKAEQVFKKQTNKISAERLFVAAGLKDEDYSELLESIVTDDADHTTKTANSFVALLKAQKEATEKAVTEQLMRNNPQPKPGAPAQIKSDRQKLIDQYNEAEKKGDIVLCQTLQAQIKAIPKE